MNDDRTGAGAMSPRVRPGGGPGQERLRRLGASALADWELLAWVLGPGAPAAENTARSLLQGPGGLAWLAMERPGVLRRMPGVGPVRSGRLMAALELGQRAAEAAPRSGPAVRRPEDCHALLRREFRGLDRERFLALYLDTRHRITDVETVSVGSLNASLVHPREVFRPAVAMRAAAVIVAHNHPSGCAEPSGDDLELTARLDRCGELLGIALLDHLVVGGEEIVSIREYGWPSA
jgi:DNA repair protein RadC